VLYLTIPYLEFNFKNKKDVNKVYRKVRQLSEILKSRYGCSNFIVNFDIVLKPNGKIHLHFNVAFNTPDEIFTQFHDREFFAKVCLLIKSVWDWRIQLSPKYKIPQRKSAISYFVKRTAEINPTPKNTEYIPMNLSMYYDLFYKTHFIRRYFWSILVVSRNKLSFADVFLSKKCPKCGSDMEFFPSYTPLEEIEDVPPNIKRNSSMQKLFFLKDDSILELQSTVDARYVADENYDNLFPYWSSRSHFYE
jgi:hypothetical protein